MLFRFVSVLALSASSVLAATHTATRTERTFNPTVPELSLARLSYHPISQREAHTLTNAKRLAARMPLLPPRKRRHAAAYHPRPSGISGNARRTDGHLEARDEYGNSVGHVCNNVNNFGQYGLTSEEEKRLIVSMDLETAQSGACDIRTKNGPDSNLPFFGGITGYSSDCDCGDLRDRSHNYAYLGATVQTFSLDPPSHGDNSFSSITRLDRSVQSAIFKYDRTTSCVSPQWVNEDGSTPTTHLGYHRGSLVLVGDRESFVDFSGDTQWVSLYFVPLL